MWNIIVFSLLIILYVGLVVEEVAGRKHTLEKNKLKVEVYYDALGVIPPGHDTSSPAAWIPSRIELKDIHERVSLL